MSELTSNSETVKTSPPTGELTVNFPFLAPEWTADFSCGYARGHLLILCEDITPLERQLKARVDEMGMETDFENRMKHEIFLEFVEHTLGMVVTLENKTYFRRLSCPWETNGRDVADKHLILQLIDTIQAIRAELSSLATILRETERGQLITATILPIKETLSALDIQLWHQIEGSFVPLIWPQQ